MSGERIDWLREGRADALALADRERRLSYGELREEAAALARELGAGPNDLVEIGRPAGVELAIALHAALLAGATVQITPGAAIGGVRRVSGGGTEGVLARVMTSGTSGEPSPVDLTAHNFRASAAASAERLGFEADDRWLLCLPPHHVGGLSILIRSAIRGTAVVIEPGFDTERVAVLMEDRVTIASLVPTQLVRLLDAGAPIDRPRLLLVGGGPLPLEVLEESLGRGATVVQTYGLTEACSQVCTLGPEEARDRAGSAGRPLAGVEVRIDGGEILVRGPIVAPASVAADGWLHTGDLGRLDDGGYLWVEGRRDDLIVTGGENVRPERVEDALRSHPGVAEVGVAGIEDREWGQIVVAWVVPGDGDQPDRESLLDHARARLARHEVPKRIEFVAELPRTASGKLIRGSLP